MIDPKTVVVMTPTHNGDVCCGYTSGLMQCGDIVGGLAFVVGMSEINLARNLVVNAFLKLPEQYEWLVCIDADMEFSRQDMLYLLENENFDGDIVSHGIVCAEYARRPIKDIESNKRFGPAKLALGFSRIHRSVFAELQRVENDAGEQMVSTFFREGEILHDYFPTGAKNDGHWLSEDHGFFLLCKLAGIAPRIETRTRLIHWGRIGAGYESGAVTLPNL